MQDDYLDDHEFVRLLAERAKFTIKDTKILWDMAKEIISENVDKKREMIFQNFITIKFSTYLKKKSWDQVHRIYVDPVVTNRISVRFSFKKREYQQRKRKEKENESI